VPLALAYLIAGPGSNADTVDQMAPYFGALIAVPAGLLGSLLVAVIPRRDAAAVRERDAAAAARRDGTTADRLRPTASAGARPRVGDTIEPTNIIPPLVTGARRRAGAGVASGVASVPRRDGNLGPAPSYAQPAQGRQPGGSGLPRRTPGARFPAGT
jgi:hypothetical protein